MLARLQPFLGSEGFEIAQHPAFQVPLTGDTAVIACHFNPAAYSSPVRNLSLFLHGMHKAQAPLYMAELSFPGQKPLLPRCARVLHLQTSKEELLWQKESLLNAVEKFVPTQFTKLAWLDADTVILRENWRAELSAMLDAHAVVQPFKRCLFTSADLTRETGARASVGYAASIGDTRRDDWRLFHCGFGWAARRFLWTEFGGLLECIGGQADSLMALAFMGKLSRSHSHAARLNDASWEAVTKWASHVMGWTGCSLSCLPADIVHLWHGTVENRGYRERVDLLSDMIPSRHLCHTADGLLSWTPEARVEIPGVIAAMTSYFSKRQEDTL